MTADRGRDVTSELVEVRTVLGRAENALATVIKHRDRQFLKGYMRHGPDDPPRGTWVEDRTPDPDVEDMIAALEEVIAKLSRWRRTGRPRKARR